jgi:pimeloyl-ACP methyl ester carboxylesterase
MSAGRFVAADGCRLAYEVVGDGLPVLWQHGLGADRAQPAEVFPARPGLCRITLECRGHGESALGDPERLSIAGFTEDVRALLDHLDIGRAVVGGISLGAAIALRLAALYPDRVGGLILARPAWVDGPSLATQAAYATVARLLAEHGVAEGARQFEASAELEAVAAVSPDNAQSLRGFFGRPDPAGTIALLSRIPRDSPGIDRAALGRIATPTLIVATAQDYVHPLAYGEQLQALLANAPLRTITSKTVDRAAYVAEFRQALDVFLALLARRPWRKP